VTMALKNPGGPFPLPIADNGIENIE
jgi:hypothetical protein